jgi:hypothetical protein
MHWKHLLPVRDRVVLGRVGWLPYAIPNWTRDTHVYVIGASGTGKSKLLESLFVADVKAGRGCGLVDPHGDLARDTLAHLLSVGFFADPDTLKRVIYFDPARTDVTIPFNVLRSRLPPYIIANHVIEAMRRTWPQSLREAPRFTNIALASLLALIEAKQSLVDMPKLMTDRVYRDHVLAAVRDPHVLEFFHNRYDQWGKGFTIESVLNKATAFTLNPHLRRCLGTNKNVLDFRHIMDAGKVFIANLGNCDDETRRLIGSLITTGLEQAATTRADHRPHFYLYLDEFQDFCANDGGAKTLAQILSECRKYNLHLHLAHQTLGQIQSRVESALGNVGIKIVFALDYDDAKVMAHKLFVDYAGSLKWEEAAATIQRLPFRTALVKSRSQRLVRLRTRNITPYMADVMSMATLMQDLVQTHGIPTVTPMNEPAQRRTVIDPTTLFDWEPKSST